jgi:hypothetical protein
MPQKDLTIKVVSNKNKIQISVSPPTLELPKGGPDEVVIKADEDVTVQFNNNGRGPLARDPGAGGYKPKKNKNFVAGKVRTNATRGKYKYSIVYVDPDTGYAYTLDPRLWVN